MKHVLLSVLILLLSGAGIAVPAGAFPQQGSFGLRLIAVRTAAEAEQLRARLESGADFEQLARQYSIDSSAGAGGNLGTVRIDQLRPEFRDALRGVVPGGLGPVVRVGNEYLLLQLLDAETVLQAPGPGSRLADRPWAEAVIANDTDRIRALLVAGAEVDSEFQDGSTALVVAAYGGHVDIVGILLDAGANVNAATRAGATPLMAAALGNHAAVIQALIGAGADVNRRAGNGSTALMEAAYAGSLDTVRILVDSGADAGFRYDGGATVLMSVAIEGNAGMVRTLLDAGADPNAALDDGSTPLMKAASGGHGEVVRLLLDAGAGVNPRAGNGSTALIEAAYAGRTEIAEVLIKAGGEVNASLDDGSTVLMAAAPGNHTGIVRMLIAAGADVHAGPEDGSTALMEAAYSGSAEVVRILLATGADVNRALDNGLTALMAAALGGYAEVVGELLEAGADAAAEDIEGRTALTHAAASGSSETVDLLLARGAEIDPDEAAVRAGMTYANAYYASNDSADLEQARLALQGVLARNPDHLAALEWMGALEVIEWNGEPDLDQFRRAHALFERSVELDPNDADRHYWIASVNWTFASRETGAATDEYRSIVDEGIDHAAAAIALDPWYDDAYAYLDLLYRLKADLAGTPAERNRFLELAETAGRDAGRVRQERDGRLTRPDDQFSRPAPLPPPQED
jgi:serine/threonine-protein phosphatase 6 regulatory ankyrin repeat subunit B